MKHLKGYLALSVWLLTLFAAAGMPACGRVAARGNDSESHFLVSCEGSCADGSPCICGVCTRECTSSADCSGLPGGVSCRSFDAGECLSGGARSGAAQPIGCDLECTQDADCAALSAEHACVSGWCRSEGSGVPLRSPNDFSEPDETAGTLSPMPPIEMTPDDVDTGAIDGTPEQNEEFFPLPPGTTCDDLQNGPLTPPLTVHVRNQRSQTIYLERYPGLGTCFEQQPLVRVERAGEDVRVRAKTNCTLECGEYVADPSRFDTPICSDVGCSYREVTPIEPGAELTEDFDREYRSFSLLLPPECRRGVPMDPFLNGYSCLRYGQIDDGEYTLTAKAFTESFNAGPIENYCTTNFQYDPNEPCFIGVEGTEITAQATTTTPRGDVDILFTE